MFDIGGWEFLLIVVLGIIIIGPKELPGAIRTVTHWVRRARGLAREFQSGLDDIVREAELQEVRSDIESGLGVDEFPNSIEDAARKAVDPDDEFGEAFDERADWYSDHDDAEEIEDAAADDKVGLNETTDAEASAEPDATDTGAKSGG